MSLSPQFLDELRSRITLSSVIGRSVRVIKAGREFKACCPFHNEKSPSFTINDEKGFYHCFGCGAHGDVIRWMTDQRGLSFIDAVKSLAVEAGMELPAPDPHMAQRAEKQKSLHDVMGAAQGFFVDQLASEEAERARAYLATRGFSPAVCREFGFGYAPEGRQALKGALGQFPEAMLIEGGLRIVVDGKEPYDRFRGRLMLPIQDARGRVIAFGGRILDKTKTDAPKYLNSPDTPLFDKGRTLYNHHRASPASRRTGRVIVVEGYMDVIALAAAGFEEAVAPLGTALTETQIEMLWRMVDVPILCFDGDAAGQRAAMRAITRALPLLRPGHSLRIVTMPQGQDPDDLIKARGPAAMEEVLGTAQPLLDALWLFERDAAPAGTPEEKAGLKKRLNDHVETIADPDIKALYRRDLLERFSDFAFPARDWSQHKNVSDIAQARRRTARQPQGQRGKFQDQSLEGPASDDLVAKHKSKPERDGHLHRRLGAAITAGLLQFPDLAIAYSEELLRVSGLDPRLELIADAAYNFGSLDREQLLTILLGMGHQAPTPKEWDHLRFPFTWPPTDEVQAVAGIEKAMALYAGRPQIMAALRHATQEFEREQTEENWNEQQRLLKRMLEFEKELRQMDRA